MEVLPRFFLLLAIASGLLVLPHQAHAVDNVPETRKESPVNVSATVYSSEGSWGIGSGGILWPSYGFGGGSLEGGGGGWRGTPYLQNNHAPAANDTRDPCENKKGRPILVNSGTKVETYPVFALPGEMGLSFTLYYNTALKIPQALSNAYWSTNLDYTLTSTNCFVDKLGDLICHTMTYQRPDGSTLIFTGAPQGGPYTENGGGGQATLTYDDASSTYTLHDEDATTKVFDVNGELKSITDPSGIGWTITTSGSSSGFTYTITHSSGKSYSITYGTTTNNITPVTVTDPAGNAYTLQRTGDSLNFLSITYPGTPSTNVSFKYALPALPYFLTEVDYNGIPYDYTSYNTTSTDPYYKRATGNYFADNSESVAINYSQDAAGNLQATITNALGHHEVQTYDGTNGAGGAYNGQLSQISHDAVATCGSTVQNRAYDANSNLSQTVDNNRNVHTYTYAATGQLQSETEASGTSLARTTDYTWDSNLQLNRPLSVTVEGWSKTTYTYNAQNRLASVQVTDLSRGANQTLTTTYGYTLYASGMVQTMTVTRPSPNNSDTDTSTYDALGNLTSVANGLGQTTTYSNYNGLGEAGHVVGPNGDVTDYVYDARGRVYTKTTYPNGTAATWTYSYDGFGLLASELTPTGGTTTWNRDAEMRVTSIVRNDKDGTSTESFGHDANGDITSHTVSRNGTTSLSETLIYDALGRVYQRLGMHSQQLTYAYDGNGNVVSVTDAVGHVVSNQYDALNRLTRKTSSGGASPLLPSAAPTLSAPANSSNGSYSMSWSTVSGATTYTLQKQLNGGGWSTVQTGGSTSFAVSSQGSGTYGYRVIACNVTGCSPWSSTATVYVTQIIGNIDSVFIDGSGNASISGWTCSTGLAQSINADLYLGGPYGTGTFIARYTANQSSEPAVASACNVSSGSYRFSIPLSTTVRGQYAGQTIYLHGISPIGAANPLLTNSGSFTVPVNEPAGAPTLSVPSSNGTGSYTVSWSAVTGATSYTLQEQVNGGAWATVQGSAATSWVASGKGNGSYGYHVQACNSSGCNAWSNVASVTVLLPPPAPASISAPATSNGPIAISWAASATATIYGLDQSVNGGSWAQVYANSATSTTVTATSSGAYSFRAYACNGSGCTGYATSGAVAVTIPPASAPSLSVPASSSNGSYTVSWTGVGGATSYSLQEQVNGGGWSTVQANGNTSWGTSGRSNGTYGYHVQACNVGGCGPWSGTSSVSVVLIPATPTGLSSTLYATYYSDTRPPKTVYTLTGSWSAMAGASNYNFHYCQQSGSCYTTNTTATSIPEFQVQGATVSVAIQACNANGCSAWSASVTPTTVNQ
jgi:YD repeat-containing protein